MKLEPNKHVPRSHTGVSKNRGTPKIINFYRVFHEINHPFWGTTIFGNTHTVVDKQQILGLNC